MKRVIVESPYAGDPVEIERNERYARACLADCLQRGEAPFASHLLYTQPGVLRDGVPEERKLGIEAGFAWREVSEVTVVYTNLGITGGMRAGIEDAEAKGRPVVYRHLEGEDW
jgi:hypothetical protein